jgi:hypothetical protein
MTAWRCTLYEHGLRRNELFRRVFESLIELSCNEGRKDECSLLESLIARMASHREHRGHRACRNTTT